MNETTLFSSVQFSSVAQSCPTLCDPMNRSTPGLPVHHQLPASCLKIVKSLLLCWKIKGGGGKDKYNCISRTMVSNWRESRSPKQIVVNKHLLFCWPSIVIHCTCTALPPIYSSSSLAWLLMIPREAAIVFTDSDTLFRYC